MPNALGQIALFRLSLAATLVGLEVPSGSKNLDIKPYAVSSLMNDSSTVPAVSNAFKGNVGMDLKYGITQSLTADLTYNTDFAQVEADEQQINLTRFSLFFPEKREFFLENQGLFAFGGAGTNVASSANNNGPNDTPILFYSRRIGFSSGRAVPIEVGGRLTGRAGRFSLGVLNIQSDDDREETRPLLVSQRTNFSVVRAKRDLFRRSSVGFIFTGRSAVEQAPGGANQVYGVDGTFPFFDNLAINTYWARTHTEGVSGDDTSYRAQVDYAGDRYGLQIERLAVGDHFSPEIGFVRRHDIRKTSGGLRFSPRMRSSKTVRKLSWSAWTSYIENGVGQLITRDRGGEFAVEFQRSDRFSLRYGDTYEFLPQPSVILGLTFAAGGYHYGATRVAYTFGQQRRMSGSVSAEYGDFYGGRKTSVILSSGRVNLTPQLSVEPTYSGNWVDLVEGLSTAHLVGSRVTCTMTPTMFLSALLQYNTGVRVASTNIRLRWEYRPGSELFVAYNDQRDTLVSRLPALANGALIVKVNRLLRF